MTYFFDLRGPKTQVASICADGIIGLKIIVGRNFVEPFLRLRVDCQIGARLLWNFLDPIILLLN
jgi:hypothetical protein